MTDQALYFQLMQDLAAAKRTGDDAAIREALDDLDVFTLHAEPSPFRSRAATEVSRHGFRAA